MGDYIERPVERETNRVVCQPPDREGPSNGRPFKAKKEKLIMIKGAVSCVVIAVLGLLVQQTGP